MSKCCRLERIMFVFLLTILISRPISFFVIWKHSADFFHFPIMNTEFPASQKPSLWRRSDCVFFWNCFQKHVWRIISHLAFFHILPLNLMLFGSQSLAKMGSLTRHGVLLNLSFLKRRSAGLSILRVSGYAELRECFDNNNIKIGSWHVY